MSTTFRPYAPDQMLLLPADLRAWLPEGHLAHHVSDQRWTPKFGQLAKVGSRPRRRSLACHGRDGVIRLS